MKDMAESIMNSVIKQSNVIDEKICTLQNWSKDGTLSPEEVQNTIRKMEDKRKELLKSIHPYSIKRITAPDGKGRKDRTRWTTRIPDSTQKNGYRQIRYPSEEALYQKLYEHYGLSGENGILTVSLAGLYDRWIEYRLSAVSKGTVKKDQATWKRYYADDPITLRPLALIKPSEAFKWLSSVVEKHHLTKRQYYEMRGVWKSIEGFAYADDLINNRIILNLGNPTESRFADEKARYAETEVFTPDEIAQVAEKAQELYGKSHFNTAYLGLVLAPYLGFRVGELSCLSWNGINRERRYISITQSEEPRYEVSDDGRIRNCGYEVVDHLKKHHSERFVPLPPEAEEILDQICSENKKHGIDSEYVFAQKNGDRVHTRAFHKALKKVYAELGWKAKKKAGIHEFRRTYATSLIGKIDDKNVQAWMGHRDWSTTKRYYQYTSREPDPSAADAVSRAFQSTKAELC